MMELNDDFFDADGDLSDEVVDDAFNGLVVGQRGIIFAQVALASRVYRKGIEEFNVIASPVDSPLDHHWFPEDDHDSV